MLVSILKNKHTWHKKKENITLLYKILALDALLLKLKGATQHNSY